MKLPPCPTCKAREGVACRRPSGHRAEPHAKRVSAATEMLRERGEPEGMYEVKGGELKLVTCYLPSEHPVVVLWEERRACLMRDKALAERASRGRAPENRAQLRLDI